MIYALLLILQVSAWSAVEMRLQFKDSQVKQGEIIEANLLVDGSTPALQGKSLGDQLYFYAVSPLVIRQGSTHMESAVKVIFTAVPESTVIMGKLDNMDVNAHIGSVKVLPTEGAEKFIFGNFTVPTAPQWLKYILGVTGVLLFLVGGFFLWKKQELKAALKEKKRKLREEILSAKNFQDLVDLWKKRQTYFEQFPHVVVPFEKFEKTLYKYQFKQSQSEIEQLEAMNSYKEFVRTIEGGFHGV
jgi:hypothetical protein